MKAIYKIENLINHKIYIGQSKNPKERFCAHCSCKVRNYSSLINKAIQKYGKQHFSFEILGWFEDYDEKEKFYIKFYNSLAPNGYNIQQGGENPPILKRESNPAHKITEEKALNIIKQLLDWKIPRKTIVANNKITYDIMRHINEGNAWRQENLIYPLRPPEKELNKYRALYIQWLCCNDTIPLNRIGQKVGWNRSSAKMINQGKNHYNDKLKYPIRDNKEYNKQILNQEACIDYLHFEE